MPPVTNVCVFCGASPGASSRFTEVALALGEALAGAGYGLVYGGGNAGLMGSVSEGALRSGAHVTGIIPQALMDREVGRTDIQDLRVVADMHERKALMYQLSAAFITLPGGLGTFEEFFETTTWSQLGFHVKPSVVLNVDGYYDPLSVLLDHAVDNGFIPPANRALVTVVDSVEAVIAELDRRIPQGAGS